eukprot:2861088-Amphidinium_carterae.1
MPDQTLWFSSCLSSSRGAREISAHVLDMIHEFNAIDVEGNRLGERVIGTETEHIDRAVVLGRVVRVHTDTAS